MENSPTLRAPNLRIEYWNRSGMNRESIPLFAIRFTLTLFVLATPPSSAQVPSNAVNPAIKQIVDSISEERIAAYLKKLEAFGTRYVMSSQNDPAHGIGAAQRWIYEEFKSYSPRLEVAYDSFTAKKNARGVTHDVDLANVVAVLPGVLYKNRYVLVTAHYDSLALVRKARANSARAAADGEAPQYSFSLDEPRAPVDWEASAKLPAPGVTDDGSGTAAVLELARVMSKYEFDKTLVFVAFSAEEVGLLGSKAYVQHAQEKKMDIEAVLNNDIIGSDVSGNGRSANGVLRVFSDAPEDSPSRALARYIKEVSERYVPSMNVDLIFRHDRFGRNGDHTAFVAAGYAAVRLSTPSENFANQHSVNDTFANTSAPYTTCVVRMNAAVAASLALAPKPPGVTRVIPAGPRKGSRMSTISRGKSGYDASMRWTLNTEPDLAGYAIVMRATVSPVCRRRSMSATLPTTRFPICRLTTW